MTVKPKPSRPPETVRSRIRAAGLRCTPARSAVLEYLLASRTPKSHADVAAGIAKAGFDQATIYRNLTELTEAGIVSRVELGDHVWRFEARRPVTAAGHRSDHPHFLCTGCGTVSCLDDVSVAITPRRPRAIRSVSEVLLKGRCVRCG